MGVAGRIALASFPAGRLKAEGYQPLIVDLPSCVPSDFPSVIVRVRDITAEATVGWCICWTKEGAASLNQPIHERLDISHGGDVVAQRNRSGAKRTCAVHIRFQGTK